jgi:hypothetical protein
VAAALIVPFAAAAQDLEPRAYANTPVGLNFLVAGYAYSSGDVATDASAPLEDAEVQTHASLFAYARSLDVLGRSGKIDVVLPYAWTSGSATFAGAPVSRSVGGFGDPRVRFSVNFCGAPALGPEEFPSYEQDWILGASLQVGIPIGQYDGDRLLNLGTNRWSFKPEIGLSKRWRAFTLELSVAGTLFTENDDFFGGNLREQDGIYAIQAHAVYAFPRGFWGALDFTVFGGGETRINGVAGLALDGSTRLGVTLSVPVDRHNSLKLYGSTGVSSRTGGSFDLVGVAWQVRFGRGF